MTHHVAVVSDTNAKKFTDKVYSQVKDFENAGFDAEIQFSTSGEDYPIYSAMIIAYEEWKKQRKN